MGRHFFHGCQTGNDFARQIRRRHKQIEPQTDSCRTDGGQKGEGNGTKENARDVIIEKKLIDLKLSGKEINLDNLMNITNNLDMDQAEKLVLNDEKNDLRRINSILENNRLNLILLDSLLPPIIVKNQYDNT